MNPARRGVVLGMWAGVLFAMAQAAAIILFCRWGLDHQDGLSRVDIAVMGMVAFAASLHTLNQARTLSIMHTKLYPPKER